MQEKRKVNGERFVYSFARTHSRARHCTCDAARERGGERERKGERERGGVGEKERKREEVEGVSLFDRPISSFVNSLSLSPRQEIAAI